MLKEVFSRLQHLRLLLKHRRCKKYNLINTVRQLKILLLLFGDSKHLRYCFRYELKRKSSFISTQIFSALVIERKRFYTEKKKIFCHRRMLNWCVIRDHLSKSIIMEFNSLLCKNCRLNFCPKYPFNLSFENMSHDHKAETAVMISIRLFAN